MYLYSVTFRKLFNPFPGFAFVLLKYFIQICSCYVGTRHRVNVESWLIQCLNVELALI